MDGAHRVAMYIEGRTPEAGQVAMHACDVPACVNPAHLTWGSKADNSADMVAKGRTACGEARRAPRGAAHKLAKLTEADVIAIRAEYAAGGITHESLGEKYGVGGPTIGKIISRKSWKHVK